MTRLLKYALPAALMIAALPAQAALIDFTKSNANPLSVAGVSVSVTGSGPLTWSPFDGDLSKAPCVSGLLACRNDGIGVGDDEVSFKDEWVIVTFSQLIDVTAIHLFDLFGINDDGQGNPAEVANIQFRRADASQIALWELTGNVNPGQNSGYRARYGLVSGVKSIKFRTSQLNSKDNSDFSIAAIEFVSVPEPSTLALLGAGLLGFGMLRRRRRG